MRYSSHDHLDRLMASHRGKRFWNCIGPGGDVNECTSEAHGLDLTNEAVKRVKRRFELRSLPFDSIVQGSILEAPFKDDTFDVVFSHGVLHHVPDILQAQKEIARILKPGGLLVVMLYARHSLNYHLSIRVLRRLGLVGAYLSGRSFGGKLGRHLELARDQGRARGLRMVR